MERKKNVGRCIPTTNSQEIKSESFILLLVCAVYKIVEKVEHIKGVRDKIDDMHIFSCFIQGNLTIAG